MRPPQSGSTRSITALLQHFAITKRRDAAYPAYASMLGGAGRGTVGAGLRVEDGGGRSLRASLAVQLVRPDRCEPDHTYTCMLANCVCAAGPSTPVCCGDVCCRVKALALVGFHHHPLCSFCASSAFYFPFRWWAPATCHLPEEAP